MAEKPTILGTEIVATTRLFQIEQLQLRFSNGVERVFERLKGRKGGAVMMVPMLDEDTVLLIREYAAGMHRYEISLPKGVIEDGEEVNEAANRELKEEVGYGANRFDRLKPLTQSPGSMVNNMKLVLARDLYEEKMEGDEPEELEVIPWKLSKLNELIEREDFTEARSIAALFMVRELLKIK